jgi:FkbM family methyltransferase
MKYAKYYIKVLWKNWTHPKNSYAQHNEDCLIDILLPRSIKSFIDIGSNDGVLFSNSYKFAKKGAKGLCVEPSRNSFRKLKLNHLFHPKVKCIQKAVSNFNGHIFLNEDGYESTLSYVSKSRKSNSYPVKCQTFDKILEDNPQFSKVDLLTVDVEGHEKQVFECLNINFYSKIIIIESDKSAIHDLLSSTSLNNYEPIFTNGINTVLKNKKESLLSLAKPPKGFSPC